MRPVRTAPPRPGVIEYSPERGAAIDPHFDDFWIWGERLCTLSLAHKAVMSFTREVPVEECGAQPAGLAEPETAAAHPEDYLTASAAQETDRCHHVAATEPSAAPRGKAEGSTRGTVIVQVAVPLPRRSLLVVEGAARHAWMHGIRREDIHGERVSATFRELTPLFRRGGELEDDGEKMLAIAGSFAA